MRTFIRWNILFTSISMVALEHYGWAIIMVVFFFLLKKKKSKVTFLKSKQSKGNSKSYNQTAATKSYDYDEVEGKRRNSNHYEEQNDINNQYHNKSSNEYEEHNSINNNYYNNKVLSLAEKRKALKRNEEDEYYKKKKAEDDAYFYRRNDGPSWKVKEADDILERSTRERHYEDTKHDYEPVCRECGEVNCRCCNRCNSYPCECCNECGEANCRCCNQCNSYPCECCRECGEANCRCCNRCDSYPCRCDDRY